ncbi:MAG: purine-nucleoside phosphorylase [Planctomycetaceae bacterium]
MDFLVPNSNSAACEFEHRVSAATACLCNGQFGGAKVAVVLGSGLGRVVDCVDIVRSLPYADIPSFPLATATGHAGQLSFGKLDGANILLMQGRKHLYEAGHVADATLPIRVLSRLGVSQLIVTNAAGGLHPDLRVGDLVVLEDCQNLMFANPLIGPHDKQWGPRFPDMSRPFDPDLIELALQAARQAGVSARRGVYAAVSGPNYETRAEQRMYRALGADVIGMSTVPEAIVAAQLGMRVLGLSTVTNCCRPDAPEPTDGGSVVHAATAAAERVLAIVRNVIRQP